MMASVLTREACLMHREPLVAISRSQPQRERDPGKGKEGSETSRGRRGLRSETRLLCIEQSIGAADAQFPTPGSRQGASTRRTRRLNTQQASHQ